jgi:hypothetical protein
VYIPAKAVCPSPLLAAAPFRVKYIALACPQLKTLYLVQGPHVARRLAYLNRLAPVLPLAPDAESPCTFLYGPPRIYLLHPDQYEEDHRNLVQEAVPMTL